MSARKKSPKAKAPLQSEVITWDWKDQVDVGELNSALRGVADPQVFEVETEGDWYAVVVAPRGTSQAKAQKLYEEHEREMAGGD